MSNMKMEALIDAEIQRARAQSAADLAALMITTAEALAIQQATIDRLERDVAALKNRESEVP